MTEIYTIGHSTHPIEKFIALAGNAGIEAIADVRSSPYSRYNPQFNREPLKDSLAENGMRYVFLGEELGARSTDPACYVNGKASYERIARTDLFQEGLERLIAGAAKLRIALMCAEAEPLDCHRTILVASALAEQGAQIRHVLSDGRVEDHKLTLDRLVGRYNGKSLDLFASHADQIAGAIKRRGEEIAYQESPTVRQTAAG